MKKIVFEVVKVCAVGCDRNFITVKYDNNEFTFFTTNRGLYEKLKNDGVPTSQSITCNFKKRKEMKK